MKTIHPKMLYKIAFSLIALLASQAAFAQSESSFYTETNNNGVTRNLVTHYGANGNDNQDDSAALQTAIDELTQLNNGGKIIIPNGKFYLRSIALKSNVHLEIAAQTTLYPTDIGDTKNYAIFDVGNNTATVRNVSIRSASGKFKVDLRSVSNKNVTVVRLGNVNNFFFSGFKVIDDNSKFSAFAFGMSEHGGGYQSPVNGIVKNSTITGAHYGYGLVQVQVGKNVLFKSLNGTGGVTLRLESGYSKLNQLQVLGIFDIVGRGIHCVNGNAALMISPHSMKNGKVDVANITGQGCGFAVRIEGGYVNEGQAPGYFANSSVVKNVTGTFGNNAQLKPKHFKFVPCEIRGQIASAPNPDGESYKGPAAAAVVDSARGSGAGNYNVTISNVTANGYQYQENAVVTDADAVTNCN